MTEIEQDFLGSMIIYADSSHHSPKQWANIITEEDFESPAARDIFVALRNLIESGRQVNLITLLDELGRDFSAARNLAEVSANYLGTFPAEIAKILRKQRVERDILRMRKAGDLAAIEELKKLLNEVEDAKIEKTAEDLYIEAFADRLNDKGFATGFREIDAKTNRLDTHDFWVIGAQGGTGKTQMALQMLKNNHKKTKCGFVSLEMSGSKIADRLIRLRETEMRKNGMSAADIDLHLFDEVKKFPFFVSNEKNVAKIENFVKNNGIKILFIDYLQLLDFHTKTESEYHKIRNVSAFLKKLTIENDLCIVALSQLAKENIDVKKNSAGFKGSDDIFNDCDVAITMRKGTEYEGEKEIECEIKKNRHGYSGFFKLTMDNNGHIHDSF